jgi:cytochrome P450
MRLSRRVEKLLDQGSEIARGISFALAEKVSTGRFYNPTAAAYQRDPYPFLRELREQDPVHRSYPAGGWIVSRYDQIESILKDPRFSSDERNHFRFKSQHALRVRAGIVPPKDNEEPVLLGLDPPAHTRLRTLVNKAFAPREVERLRPRAEKIVDEILWKLQEESSAEVIHELATPLPVRLIAEALGIPAADYKLFKHWSDEIVLQLGDPTLENQRRAQQATAKLNEYLTPVVQQRRQEGHEDLISGLVHAQENGSQLEDDELLRMVGLLLVAGNETTTHLIGNGLLALLQHPAELDRLRDEPERIETAVEECLRYNSPVHITRRIALEAVEFGGRRFRPGQLILLVLGGANRDPAAFPDPDRFDIARSPNRHLSFGLGVHFCLGSQLARMEAQIALSALLARFPDLSLACAEPVWRPNPILRGLTALPVRLR